MQSISTNYLQKIRKSGWIQDLLDDLIDRVIDCQCADFHDVRFLQYVILQLVKLADALAANSVLKAQFFGTFLAQRAHHLLEWLEPHR